MWHLWAAAEEADAEAEAAGGDLRGAELPWEPIRLRERERDARVAQDVSRFHVQQEQVRYGQYGVLKPLATMYFCYCNHQHHTNIEHYSCPNLRVHPLMFIHPDHLSNSSTRTPERLLLPRRAQSARPLLHLRHRSD